MANEIEPVKGFKLLYSTEELDRMPGVDTDIEFSLPFNFFLPSALCLSLTKQLVPWHGAQAMDKAKEYIDLAVAAEKANGGEFGAELRRIVREDLNLEVTIDLEAEVVQPKQLPSA